MKFLEDFFKKNEQIVCLVVSFILVIFILESCFMLEGFKEGIDHEDEEDEGDEGDEGDDMMEESNSRIEKHVTDNKKMLKTLIDKYNSHSHSTGMTGDGKIQPEYNVENYMDEE